MHVEYVLVDDARDLSISNIRRESDLQWHGFCAMERYGSGRTIQIEQNADNEAGEAKNGCAVSPNLETGQSRFFWRH